MFDLHTSVGPPNEKIFRGFRPPRPVWVDLSRAYPLGPPRASVPDGLDLGEVVEGRLSMWQMTTTGHWVGWVEFMINKGRGGAKAGQWVSGEALRPRMGEVR
ncbi:Hypothetical protein AJAP_27835 [Amycolatopsis japonica]|uniref:Uncharacterized protein n=1 Tax=Amycolatopsis japonica TaxID=208439 RepID=A0A075UW66_9PSEU|nr:Hypothetical protein AJAP_27835 [Amycolatopsis japonica]